jgi:hypothetical protein
MTAATSSQEVRPRSGGAGPAWTLVFLAPFIAEVLSGATKVSVIFVLIPEMMVWGCGALLIRELVRRWGGGWPSLLSLGLALSIAEEFIIQQTSVAPLPFPGVLAHYGRVWGVNWIYFLFMLGFESVWVVLVPVGVTELIFAERGKRLWLRTRGMVIATVVFLLGARIAWYAWVKRARPMILHVPEYHPPLATIVAGFGGIALLAALAWAMRSCGTSAVASRWTPPAWLVLLAVLVLGFPWYGLMGFVFTPKQPHVDFWVPMAAGVAWAILAMAVLGTWAASAQWSDLHRWAMTFAATLVCMGAGFLGSSTWLRVDLIGKIVLNLAAVAGFAILLRKLLPQKAGVAETQS